MSDNIRITRDELFNKNVDDIILKQEAMQRAAPSLEPTPLWRKIIFSSLFFMAVGGCLGGFAGWLVLEPFINEAVDVNGTIDDIGLPPMIEAPGARQLSVRNMRVIVAEKITKVQGTGEYAGVNSVGDLKTGQTVSMSAMILDADRQVLLCNRLKVQPLSQKQLNEPPPNLRDMARYSLLSGVLGFAVVGAGIAGLIAAADGLMSRNLRRGLLCGVCGVGIAIAGGLLGLIPGGMVFSVFISLTTAASDGMWSSESVSGLPLLLLVIGRSLTWGILGLTVGLGQGIALRNKKLIINGLLGGMLGGLLGGIFFDPITKIFANTEMSGQAMVSRAFGFSIIGLSAGLMIGLVEMLAKDAWLLMLAGPLAGKQFITYKNPTAIGSSPKCEIYLFKDPDVEPRHALIHKVGNRHEIEALDTASGTFVNNMRVKRQVLRDGDRIAVGQAVFEYSERARRDK